MRYLSVMKQALLSLTVFLHLTLSAQTYFPPLTGSTWQGAAFNEFPYDSSFTDSLYRFLEQNNSKAFIVLYDGKIVKEKYFGTFTMDSAWYWASAGKSLTAFLVGQAREKSGLEIGLPVSHYLGNGWTTCSPQQEEDIKVWHLLSMSTGLDENVPDLDCTDPSCLKFKAEPGTRWYYHNAPYHLSHPVIEAASGLSLQAFTNQNLSIKTGITGLWFDHVFYSKPRSAARYGLLMLNGGVWNGDTLLHDRDYFDSMINSSQSMNPAYGLLWWLNGKDTLMLPQTSVRLPMVLNEAAPGDMYAALGKNDQKIYVVPSEKLVVVRVGDAAEGTFMGPSSFDVKLWEHLNRWRQLPNGLQTDRSPSSMPYPNPFYGWIQLPENMVSFTLHAADGREIQVPLEGGKLKTDGLAEGVYWLRITTAEGTRCFLMQSGR